MADNTIDSLVLEISSNSKGAEDALAKLAGSLQNMSNSLGGMNTAKFMYISKGIREMSSSLAGFSSNVKLADFNRVFNGLNKIAAIDAAGVRSTAVAMNGLMKSLNNLTFLNFDTKGITDVANGIAKLGRGTVTQAATNIPLLTESLKGLSDGLKGLEINFDIDGLLQLTTSIQKLGSKSATKAAETNILALGKALKEMIEILSKAPSVSQNVIQMTNALAQLAAAGGRAGTASRSLVGSFNLLPSSVGKTKKGFSGLAGAIGKFYATYWLLIRSIGGFRKAIDISSDLTEVQNVVDVTFGEMADTMNEFADSALQNYGMSELMAKQIASRFQAMGVSMGFAQGKMSEMSIELTKLAGDMASFYNESQESVAKALQSIFTGETEPMRRFGLDLSFATVEAWALANGLEADMQKMTQSEKTMLRYQYVLANTGAASGDFLRTINSWHNQLVLLAGSFKQLGGIVGGVLINAFKPFIQALNSVMGAVINFAQVVSDALGSIFGWEYQTGGGVAHDLEDGFGAASGIEDSLGGAADKAKKLKSYLIGIDELNVLEPDTESGDSGVGGGATSSGGLDADGGKWVQKESLWEKYTSSIKSLEKLGEYISDTLTNSMNSIKWDKVYKGAEDFGTGLASFLNGLISPELFGSTGQTIAGALNTAIYAALSFGETFDWEDLGESIAEGVNDFFATFDFASLANTIDTWVQGIWNTIKIAFLGDENGEGGIDWSKVWDGAKEFLSEIDLETLEIIVGAITVKGITENLFSVEALKAIGNTIKLENLKFLLSGYTVSFVGGPAFDVIGTKIIELTNQFLTENFGESAVNAMGEGLLIAVSSGFGFILGGPLGALIGAGVGVALDTFVVKGEHITKFWGNINKTLFNFSFSKKLLDESKKFFSDAFNSDNFFEFGGNIIAGIGSGITAAISFLLEPIGDLFSFVVEKICDIFGIHSPAENTKFIGVQIINGIIEGFKNTISNWFEIIVSWGKETISKFFSFGKRTVSEGYNKGISDNYQSTNKPITDWANGILNWFTGGGTDKKRINIAAFGQIASNSITGFKDWILNHFGESQNSINTWASGIISWFTGDSSGNGTDIGKINTSAFGSFANNMISGFRNWTELHFDETKSPISSWVSGIVSWFTGDGKIGGINDTTFGGYSNNILTAFNKKIGSDYTTSKSPMETWSSKIKEWFWGDGIQSSENGIASRFWDFGKWIMDGLIGGVKSLWEKAKDVFSDLCDMVNNIIEKKEEINSPSKRFFRYGSYMTKGLVEGLEYGKGDVYSSVDKIMSGINSRSETIRLNIPDIDVSPSNFAMRSISADAVVDSRATISIETSLEAAFERVIYTSLIPSMRENSNNQNDLLREIASKDTNVYMDGRRVNSMLSARQSRSGYSIKK